ncbi:MAG TPA: hypothetical protein VGB97_04345 [Candidatus Paceibacterota bacterium]|jgi:hypothetical protein
MSHRLLALLCILSSVALTLVVSVLYHYPAYVVSCRDADACLSQDAFFGTVQPLYQHAWLLIPVSLTLVFVRREVFFAWANVVLPLTALGILLAFSAEPVSHGFSPGLPDRAQVIAGWIRIIVVATVLVITFKQLQCSLKARKGA